MGDFGIDSHKLALHPRRVADWLDGRDIAPIYVEISPSGSCNHRCRFCGMDFVGYPSRRLPAGVIKERLAEMGAAGVKSVMFAGEGEPFLHPEMPDIAAAAKNAGIDVAFTTNGVLLTPDKAEKIVPLASWIKVSCNAGTAGTYSHMHGAPAGDFDRMWRNMEAAIGIRARLGASCAIGFQMLVFPENRSEARDLALRVRDAGGDYLVLKPYSAGPHAPHPEYRDLRYGDCEDLASLSGLDTESFRVVFRGETFKRIENKKSAYPRCLALPFWGYVDSGGNFWGCLRHIGEDGFNFGNLTERGFSDIVNGRERKARLCRWAESGDSSECHVACRMDAINAYLWSLRNPPPHANFI